MKKVRRGGVDAGSKGLEPSWNLNSSKLISSMATSPAVELLTPICVHRNTRSWQKLASMVPDGRARALQRSEPFSSNSMWGSLEMLPVLGRSDRGQVKMVGVPKVGTHTAGLATNAVLM